MTCGPPSWCFRVCPSPCAPTSLSRSPLRSRSANLCTEVAAPSSRMLHRAAPAPPAPRGRRYRRARSRCCLDEAQDDLLARQGDAEGHHPRIRGEGLAVEDECHDVIAVEAPRLQGCNCSAARPDEAAGDRGGAEAEASGTASRSPGNRGSSGPPGPCGRGRRRHCAAPGAAGSSAAGSPGAGADPEAAATSTGLLVGEEDRARAAGPSGQRPPWAVRLYFGRRALHLRLHHLGEGLEAQGNQGLDEGGSWRRGP